MIRQKHYHFTSESVSKGHPDKLCDQISDLVVDMYLKDDPFSRTAIETLATTNRVIVAGEIKGSQAVTTQIEDAVRAFIQTIGYQQETFHYEKLIFHNYLHTQSQDIARGIDHYEKESEGAGDQGIMFGYACNETDVFMPAALYWCNRILESLEKQRQKNYLTILGPDAKTQLTLIYENFRPIGVKTVVLSTQHHPDISVEQVKDIVIPIIQETLPFGWCNDQTEFLVNPTGRFVVGGPDGDCGLTGRKIIVDTYGGAAPHGGGAFSGKDPTKVDRSAAYMARYLAKNIVAAGLSEKCLIQISYGIGVSRPLSLYVDFQGTGKIFEDEARDYILQHFSLTPHFIRTHLGLNKPIYLPTASYGHFGREASQDGHFSWEKTDLVDQFRELL